MQYWLILFRQVDGSYKYYIGESNDGANVCKLKFVDEVGSEYRHPSGKTLRKAATDEAANPTPANGQPLVKGPFTIDELKTEVETLYAANPPLILEEHRTATLLMGFTRAGRKRRRKSKKQKRKSTKRKKKSKRNKSRRRR